MLPAFRDSLNEDERKAFIADFKLYKSTGKLPERFGRDVPYHFPKEALEEELLHLHLNVDDPWPISYLQYDRTSDVHLVYCQGATQKNCFFLMTILSPDAHEQAKNIDLMLKLAEKAESFRKEF
jgi:mRNA interferase YafO